MKNFYILLLLVGTSLSQNGGVSLEIQNVDTGAGTLDIYMSNYSGCSYCEDSNYNNNYLDWTEHKEYCEHPSIGNATWIAYDPITEEECSAIPSLDGNGGWWFNGEVGGFQFQLFGATIDGAGGGSAEDNGFMIVTGAETYNEETNTQLPNILAFTMTGTYIPSGSGILIQVSFSNFDGEICFGEDTGSAGGTAMSGSSAEYLSTDWGNCWCAEGYDLDCAGVCGGTAEEDGCGICGGDNSTCDPDYTDCAGVINGDNVEDMCGTCDNEPANDCVQDCNEEWGGTAELDECGICNGNDNDGDGICEIQLSGQVELESDTDYSDILIRFERYSPTIDTLEISTDYSGDFSISLVSGIYNIHFEKYG